MKNGFRIDQKDKFWLVTDPSPTSKLGDICSETTITGLQFMFRGGLEVTDHKPVIYSDEISAMEDAQRRLRERERKEEVR